MRESDVGLWRRTMSYAGPDITPLIYVEVSAICSEDELEPELSSPLVKDEMIRACNRHQNLGARWNNSEDEASASLRSGILFVSSLTHESDGDVNEVIYLTQQNPCLPEKFPCRCTGSGFVGINNKIKTKVQVTDGTLVRILPYRDSLETRLCGELPTLPPALYLQEEVLQNQNPETLQQLSTRLTRHLNGKIRVGTTHDALPDQRKAIQRRRRMERQVSQTLGLGRGHTNVNPEDSTQAVTSSSPFREHCLIVHSPSHGAGKTLLVETIARSKLGCDEVYVLQAGAVFSKFGIHSDAALERILHSIAIRSAVRNMPVCVILDNLENFIPPHLSKSTSVGDAAVPVLNGILSLLQRVSSELVNKRELSFPTKDALYNYRGSNGYVVEARLCLVAIVTCPDDGWRNQRDDALSTNRLNIFDSLNGGQYRLPTLSATTRLASFQNALHLHCGPISPDLENRLPSISASCTWAYGESFTKVATAIKNRVGVSSPVKTSDFQQALRSCAKKGNGSAIDVQFMTTDEAADDYFRVVGGNAEAKIALRECLSLDQGVRDILNACSMPQPSGVLLYGPPGCGKTLLAKSVARLLRSPASSIGGAFISLNIADVVLAEVGSSEKVVSSAFETARLNAPSVVFIDEFQALFTDRSSGGSSRLTSTLLHCMDDVVKWQLLDKNVKRPERIIVLAATNTPWMIDSSFLRPGRFDKLVQVDLPSLQDREEILRIQSLQMNLDPGIETEALIKRIAMLTDSYSGADLAALCRASAVQCLRESHQFIREEHFLSALDGRTASQNEALVRRIQKWKARR